MSSGVLPSWFSLAVSAPLLSRMDAMSVWPLSAARCSAVQPLLSALMSIPCSSSVLIVSGWPYLRQQQSRAFGKKYWRDGESAHNKCPPDGEVQGVPPLVLRVVHPRARLDKQPRLLRLAVPCCQVEASPALPFPVECAQLFLDGF